ncbi:MAG: hypothetical protein U5K37_11545 [Natrialbaceae archaeon]|nr:hypothetical protein [Natrialbaceae archaeon]
MLDRFEQPYSNDFPKTPGFESYVIGSDAWSDDVPPVSPFGSYFVYLESPTTIAPGVSNVTDKADADAQLQLPAPDVTIAGTSNTTLVSANETTP